MSTEKDNTTHALASPAAFTEEIMLMAEKLGELSDRFEKIESEFATQTAPLDGAKAAQDAALVALQAAIKGIEQLNFHVLQNNLGAVSDRVAKVDESWRSKATEPLLSIKQVDSALVEVASQLRSELASVNKGRVELSRNLATETGEVKTMLGQIGSKLAEVRDEFARQLAEARTQFQTPTSLNPRGDWSPRETYDRLDVVTLNGTSYIAQRRTQEKPRAGSADWQVLARRGAAVGNGASSFEPTSLAVLIDEATIKWDLGNPVAVVTLAGSRILDVRNVRNGGTYLLLVVQGGSGSYGITWPSSVRWAGGIAPTLTATVGRTDVFQFVAAGGILYGSFAQNYTA
jgi:hypothetical protein